MTPVEASALSEPAHKGPAYRIETQRLVLRCWQPTDAVALNTALRQSWDHLAPWMPWARGPRPSVADTVSMLRRWRGEFDLDQDFVYGIFNADESCVLGSSGLHTRRGNGAREIGYWLHQDHVKQGYATEAAAALTRVAFEVDGVQRVEIHCVPHNARSAAVPRRLGYSHEATLRRRIQSGPDAWEDDMIWVLFADRYPDSAAAGSDIRAYDALGRRFEL